MDKPTNPPRPPQPRSYFICGDTVRLHFASKAESLAWVKAQKQAQAEEKK